MSFLYPCSFCYTAPPDFPESDEKSPLSPTPCGNFRALPSDNALEDRDTYPSISRELRGVRSPSLTGVSEFGGPPPSRTSRSPSLPRHPDPPIWCPGRPGAPAFLAIRISRSGFLGGPRASSDLGLPEFPNLPNFANPYDFPNLWRF